MSTIVIQTTKNIPSPRYGKLDNVTAEDPSVDLPPLPEPMPDTAPYIMLDARTLSAANNAQITSFVGTGDASASERTFGNPRANTNWTYPVFDSSGNIKSLRFDGNQAMTNSNTSVVLPRASYLVVARVTPHNSQSSTTDQRTRLFTGSVPDGFHGLAPRQGRFWMGAGLDNDVEVASVPDGWFVGVFVYDGSNSKLALSNSDAVQNLSGIGTSGQSRISIGGNTNFSDPTDSAMVGNIAMFAQYNKALSDIEIMQIIKYYKQDFGI